MLAVPQNSPQRTALGLFTTTLAAGSFISSWALAFWICAVLLFQLGGERLYLLLLLRDRGLQVLNCEIEHGLLGGIGNGLGLDAFGRKSTGIPSAATVTVPNLPSESTITTAASSRRKPAHHRYCR